MDLHENARTTPRSRILMIERLEAGWTVAAVAAAIAVDPKTVRKWRDRYRAEGEAGLMDRSSRPRTSPAGAAACLDGWTCSAPLRAWPIGGSRGQAARHPLRTRTSGRTDPHRHRKSSAGSTASATASPATACARARSAAQDGKPFVSLSTMLRASPTPKSCPTRRRQARQPSSLGHSPSSRGTALPSSGG